jgi:Ca-activated chloride channel family protein
MRELWDRLDFGFFEPIWLAVGALAVVAVILLEMGARRRRRQAVHLFAAEHLVPGLTASVSPGKRLLKRVLLISAVALVFIALARPHLFYQWSEETRSGLDVLIAVDCSKSMLTEDVKPNRIERAKLAVEDFAERLPDNRLGLIAFAGDAFLECPLTLDHEAFLDATRDLDTDTIPRPGTDLATAIDEAVEALRSQPNNLKFMILVTDGEDLEGRAIASAQEAAKQGMKIYTVGVGTPEGGLIPQRDDSGGVTFLRDSNDDVVHSRLDESTLTQIAQITGGAYEPLGQRGEGLQAIYDRYIATLPKQNLEERRQKIRWEQYEWPLGLAIILLVAEFLLRERARLTVIPAVEPPRRSRRAAPEIAAAARLLLLAALWGLAPGIGRAASQATIAERDYKSGQYADSAQKYGEASANQPDRHDLLYDEGDAAYRAGEYDEAEDAFHKALQTPDLKLQENSYYNLGNTQFKHGEAMEKVDQQRTQQLWEGALHSYESALKLRDAADTRHNYEVVKKKLEELKKQQQQQQQQSQQKQSQSNDQNQQQQNSQGGQSQGQGNPQNQQNQGSSQSNPQGNGQNQAQQQPQNNPGQQGQQGQDKNMAGQAQQDKNATAQQRARSGGERAQDQQDPQIKSREEAEALLDSLKDDEHQVTARSLYGNNEPPPTASGKDW